MPPHERDIHMIRIRSERVRLGLLVLLSLLLACQVRADTPTLTFGVVPQQSASQLGELWIPLLDRVGTASNVKLVFATAPSIEDFERRLLAGQYDLAYMNPYHYTVFCRKPGYVAFAKEKDRLIKGIFVVARDSPVQSLSDLADETIVFPSPAAFAASVLTQAELHQRGVAFTARYVNSHDSVYQVVAKGLFPAGGGITRTFESQPDALKAQLRILAETGSYTPHAFAYHPRIDPALIQRVQQAFVAVGSDADGMALLQKLSMKGITRARDADWNDIRALNIQLLEPLLKE